MHPDLFALAQEYEERAVEFGEQFYWCQNETLADIATPERRDEIRRNWEASQARKRAQRKNLALVETLGGMEPEDDPGLRDGCLICSL